MRVDVGGSSSSGNCYAITDETTGKILLLDAGIKIQEIKKLIKWKVGDVVGVFISHAHL